MVFDTAEKLAMVHVIDAVVLADDVIHNGEINAVCRLMKIIDFDSNFLIQARSIHTQQSRAILRNMSQVKKENSKQILEDDARSDGFVHKKEHKIIHHILSVIGIK